MTQPEEEGLLVRAQGWRVQVLQGAADNPVDGPVEFGTPEVKLGPDGKLSDPGVPLIYAPVDLRSIGDTLVIETGFDDLSGFASADHQIHREMVVRRVEFQGWEGIRIEGFEQQKDGGLVLAIWEINPDWR